MTHIVVLDAAAFDAIGSTSLDFRAWVTKSLASSGDLRCAALTLAEVCRGAARTRQVEAALRRDHGGRRITIVPTD